MVYANICNHILKSDPSIRFAGIALADGNILTADYRPGVKPLLTDKDAQLSMMQALMRDAIRRTMKDKIGRTIYSMTLYEKVKRASITLYDGTGETEALLMVSFEKEANHEAIIVEKIIPFLASVGKVAKG